MASNEAGDRFELQLLQLERRYEAAVTELRALQQHHAAEQAELRLENGRLRLRAPPSNDTSNDAPTTCTALLHCPSSSARLLDSRGLACLGARRWRGSCCLGGLWRQRGGTGGSKAGRDPASRTSCQAGGQAGGRAGRRAGSRRSSAPWRRASCRPCPRRRQAPRRRTRTRRCTRLHGGWVWAGDWVGRDGAQARPGCSVQGLRPGGPCAVQLVRGVQVGRCQASCRCLAAAGPGQRHTPLPLAGAFAGAAALPLAGAFAGAAALPLAGCARLAAGCCLAGAAPRLRPCCFAGCSSSCCCCCSSSPFFSPSSSSPGSSYTRSSSEPLSLSLSLSSESSSEACSPSSCLDSESEASASSDSRYCVRGARLAGALRAAALLAGAFLAPLGPASSAAGRVRKVGCAVWVAGAGRPGAAGRAGVGALVQRVWAGALAQR
jgi:hypothetical protein